MPQISLYAGMFSRYCRDPSEDDQQLDLIEWLLYGRYRKDPPEIFFYYPWEVGPNYDPAVWLRQEEEGREYQRIKDFDRIYCDDGWG